MVTSTENARSAVCGLWSEVGTMTTLGEVLDLLDANRESEEMVEIMDHNGQVQCRAMVCSVVWNGIEERTVNSMQAVDDRLQIWLND